MIRESGNGVSESAGPDSGAKDLLEDFFHSSNIFLVVGATNKREKYGSKVFLDLQGAGYNVVAINNKARAGAEIHGTPVYPSITAFLERVERFFTAAKRAETIQKIVLVLVVPPKAALAVVKEGAEQGISKAWFQPGAESGEALAFCKEHGITAIHNQCVMVRRPKS